MASTVGPMEQRFITVAVADDSVTFRMALVELLLGEPDLLLAGVAKNSVEAVELARSRRPDVMLLDWIMPLGEGPETVRGIKSCSPETRVIVVTGRDSRASKEKVRSSGADSHLVKGVATQSLLREIREGTRRAAHP